MICMKIKKLTLITLAIYLILLILPVFASAEEKLSLEKTAKSVDFVWVLIAAFLVFMMQAGFAMVETGFTRAKNACNIMMKNLLDFCCGALAYWAIGFGLMFGVGNLFFGKTNFFLGGTDMWQYAFWMFQVVFAATAATIVSGAVAERIKFIGYIIYTVFISALIYPLDMGRRLVI